MSNPTPNPDSNYDPAGSTQMFRAFVDEQQPAGEIQRAQSRGSKAGPVIGVIVALVVVVAIVALAMR